MIIAIALTIFALPDQGARWAPEKVLDALRTCPYYESLRSFYFEEPKKLEETLSRIAATMRKLSSCPTSVMRDAMSLLQQERRMDLIHAVKFKGLRSRVPRRYGEDDRSYEGRLFVSSEIHQRTEWGIFVCTLLFDTTIKLVVPASEGDAGFRRTYFDNAFGFDERDYQFPFRFDGTKLKLIGYPGGGQGFVAFFPLDSFNWYEKRFKRRKLGRDAPQFCK